ncbi:MAG: HzsA-related protein, partial [Thermoguttaceae bacterium]
MSLSAPAALGEATAQQELYWWQDEMREVAAELGIARDGRVSQWPQMAVASGSAVMPLPVAAGAIACDGRLDEPAWQEATSFPIGPLFDDWRAGPFMVQLSACRDAGNLYLAIRSRRDLAGLGSLSPDGRLFTVGKTGYRLGPGGNIAAENVGQDGPWQVLELSFPLAGTTTLSFSAENLRYRDGKLPPAAAWLGLDRMASPEGAGDHRKEALWLKPLAVKLVPAQGALRLAAGDLAAGSSSGKVVAPVSWEREATGVKCSWTGFSYGFPHEQTTREDYCRAREARARTHLALLDAPLLFVKRNPYFAAHIYDDYYTWHPGGGIYLRERPNDPSSLGEVRPVIDSKTNQTLGAGVYRDPDLSWDARELVFAYRPDAESVTSLYRIRLDGSGLKRLTASDEDHDVTPAWLADNRIVFTSTRPKALVPCFNSGVNTLHTMNADGSDLRSISANNVNEFDPAVLTDGRVLYGRWEYVDKTALYMQSLWTVSPDGRMEEALFGNNLARPTALLDAQPVPGSPRIFASLTPHNGQAVGAIGLIDTRLGKNDLRAITNFTPEYPVEMDQGLRTGPCDPWPLSEDEVLVSNNAIGSHGIVELVSRQGLRELVHCDPEISCFSPILARPRKQPMTVTELARPERTGKFLLVDVYQGLVGVERGRVKKLRILEETARTSSIPPGGRWWNQAFLVSWQGAYIVKNILGTVPVHEDGSASFEVPAGRAVYFEALDAKGREIQRMRSFVQAVAGTTRSCTGCHESKKAAPIRDGRPPLAMTGPPAVPQPESWGSGYIDYPTMIQPILDRHCVRCHGGPEGFAHGLDFSGGWTWAFNIGYETLIKHRLVGFLNCHNSSVHTSQILPPGTIGSGAAPLADVFLEKHPEVPQPERELILAWMDTNSNYYGTWDYTPYATCQAILETQAPLCDVMKAAGCTRCHAPGHIGSDWVNLETPEWSRILRAPMAKADGGLGVEFCRPRKAARGYPLVTQAVQPPDVFLPSIEPECNPEGQPHVTFSGTEDPQYRPMLGIIRQAQARALARPRVDMPGAEIEPGRCRLQVSIPVSEPPPGLAAAAGADGSVQLSWLRTARLIGLQYELHRSTSAQFQPDQATQIGLTTAGRFLDREPPSGTQHYALVVTSGSERSAPVWTTLQVPPPQAPAAPVDLAAEPAPGEVRLAWRHPLPVGLRYNVYR